MPARSMTGFGAAEREAAGVRARAEARSVNHRSLDIKLRLPSALDARSSAFEAAVRRRVVRGTVTVSVVMERTRTGAPSRIARAVVADYARQAAEVADECGIDPPTLGDLLRLPGALEDAPAQGVSAEEAAVAEDAADAALADMVAMRDREGAALGVELHALVDQLEAAAAHVESRSPESVAAQRDRLKERLAVLLAPGQSMSDDVIAREIAILADRTDIAEEVARLRSHVAQWREALDTGGAVGRRLDFLTQELGRETNTIGSKCQDAEMTRTVVDMKVVVERLKEQAANLE